MVLISGCAGRQKQADDFPLPGQTDLLIEEFTIQGVEALEEGELRAGLVTKERSWRSRDSVRWVPGLGQKPETFNYVQWREDLQRIRTFYHARGYFSAAIVSERVTEHPERGVVTLQITINEGQPTSVRSVEILGLQTAELRDADVFAGLRLSRGEVFTQSAYVETREFIGRTLQEHGYAYARVEGRAVVQPKTRTADIVFHVDPGPVSTIGSVTIEGLDTIEEEHVREALTLEEGETYAPSKLQQAQEAIYDLGVFATVKVDPEFATPPQEAEEEAEEAAPVEVGGLGSIIGRAQEEAEARVTLDPVIDVNVRLNEAKLWYARAGAGVAADVVRQDVHGRADWGSRNFLGGLRKLEHFNTAGYAWAPSFLGSTAAGNEGVIVDSELRFTQPQFFERLTRAETRLRVRRTVELGYTLINPTASLGVRRTFFRRLRAEVSYNYALFILSNMNQALLDPDLLLQSEYILEYFQQRLTYDARNDFLNPTRGWSLQLEMKEATSYLGHIPGNPYGGHFDFLAPQLTGDVYVPLSLFGFVVLAARAQLASIYTVGRAKQPPISQRLFAGGSASFRSLGRKQLAMYTLENEAIPVGGLTKFEAGIEPRIRLAKDFLGVGDLWMAPFFDAATVLPGPLGFEVTPLSGGPESPSRLLSTLIYGAGVGGWWVTPVGPVRVDFGYTLSNLEEDGRFRRCLVKADFNMTCPPEARVPLEEDEIQERLSKFNVIIGIGHSF